MRPRSRRPAPHLPGLDPGPRPPSARHPAPRLYRPDARLVALATLAEAPTLRGIDVSEPDPTPFELEARKAICRNLAALALAGHEDALDAEWAALVAEAKDPVGDGLGDVSGLDCREACRRFVERDRARQAGIRRRERAVRARGIIVAVAVALLAEGGDRGGLRRAG